jgi:hypothetical protein
MRWAKRGIQSILFASIARKHFPVHSLILEGNHTVIYITTNKQDQCVVGVVRPLLASV